MSRSHRKHREKPKRPRTDLDKAASVRKTPKQERPNERQKLRKEYM